MKMQKILKILGKRGRITIPWEIRKELGFAYNDVVSFEMNANTVLVKREKICDGCNVNEYERSSYSSSHKAEHPIPTPEPKPNSAVLTELLDDLTPDELRTALIHLSLKWAEMIDSAKDGDGNA